MVELFLFLFLVFLLLEFKGGEYCFLYFNFSLYSLLDIECKSLNF